MADGRMERLFRWEVARVSVLLAIVLLWSDSILPVLVAWVTATLLSVAQERSEATR